MNSFTCVAKYTLGKHNWIAAQSIKAISAHCLFLRTGAGIPRSDGSVTAGLQVIV